jgi:hypothetical protein
MTILQIKSFPVDSLKIDEETVDGLLGANNSLAYKVHEIERHLHNSEFWYGDDGDTTMSRANNHNPWTLTASASVNTYGTEVQLGDGSDIVVDRATCVKFDLHKIAVTESSVNDKNYTIQFWTGIGIFSAATFLTEVVYRTGGNSAEAQPIPVICPRVSVGSKLWARVKCETGSGTVDILVGVHCYDG